MCHSYLFTLRLQSSSVKYRHGNSLVFTENGWSHCLRIDWFTISNAPWISKFFRSTRFYKIMESRKWRKFWKLCQPGVLSQHTSVCEEPSNYSIFLFGIFLTHLKKQFTYVAPLLTSLLRKVSVGGRISTNRFWGAYMVANNFTFL